MHINIINLIVNSGIGIGIFIAVVYYAIMKKKNKPDIFFSLLMLVFSFVILHSTFIVQNYINIFVVKEPFLLLIFPFIYLYCKSVTEDFKFNIIEMKHFILFIIIFGIEIINLVTGISKHIQRFEKILSLFMVLMLIVQSGIYIVLIYKMIGNYDNIIENEFSEVENLKLTWLKTFLFIFASVFLILVLFFILLVHGGNVSGFNTILSLYFSITVFVLGYFAFVRQSWQISNNQNINKTEIFNNENNHTEDNKLFNKLLKYMEEEKAFMEPNLTLTELANRLGTNRNNLSRLINTKTDKNFFNFINEYRVNEVKEALKNPQNQNYTLLAIAFECGFNSKSSFNSVFKKFTGLTPSQYLQSLSS